MGVISRRLFPVCETMCVCCPAFRASSKQPVKRYKKLLTEIFPKFPDDRPNDRKILKLCEYASKNPFRIPKIAKYLEERCYKELRSGNTKVVAIVAEAFNKLLCVCKEQMAYFSANLLNVVIELLDESKQESVLMIGCNTVATFIYCQVDCTYAHSIESLVGKACKLSHRNGTDKKTCALRASSLKCLSAMIWFMAEFSHIFSDFEKIVYATLDNYGIESRNAEEEEGRQLNHNWVDEVERCEGRVPSMTTGIGGCSPGLSVMRLRSERKDPSLLTSEEIENPQVWAQICIQRMIDMSKETTTMRRALDLMFSYFDMKNLWASPNGLAYVVLSDMISFIEKPGYHQLVLAGIVRHLDHKNVAHDPELKRHIVQITSCLARQIHSKSAAISDIGFVSDLFRHLRRAFQAAAESDGEQQLSVNAALQTSIEICLLETIRGVVDLRPLFDMMTIAMEKLSAVRLVAQSTLASLIILAHVISLVSASFQSPQVLPETLFVQILKLMLHSDVEIRYGGHQILCGLLIPGFAHAKTDVFNQPRRWQCKSESTFSSITALLEKLRFELLYGCKGSNQKSEKDDYYLAEENRHGKSYKNSPNMHIISSIVDRTTGPAKNFSDNENYLLCCNEDQILQLLSTLWIQVNSADNLPANIEAISHSFCLAVIYSRFKNSDDSLALKFFQLPLSIRRMILHSSNDVSLPAAYQRSLLVLSTAMLIFSAKLYLNTEASKLQSLLLPGCDADPYFGITDDFQVYVKPQSEARDDYSWFSYNDEALSSLVALREMGQGSEQAVMAILAAGLSTLMKFEVEDVLKQFSEGFVPEDGFIFGAQSVLGIDGVACHSKESQSFDGEFSTNSLIEDDAASISSSIVDVSSFVHKVSASASPLMSHIVSIGQLLESALEVASQVAGASVSTSPLPYSAITNQCEVDARKKLSNWLANGDDTKPSNSASAMSAIEKIRCNGSDYVPSLRLPPASPFDNFLKAARG